MKKKYSINLMKGTELLNKSEYLILTYLYDMRIYFLIF